MNFLNRQLILVFALLFSLCSCTMEKRVYMKGYYTSWNKSKVAIENKNAKIKKDNSSKNEFYTQVTTAHDVVAVSIKQENSDGLLSASIENKPSFSKAVHKFKNSNKINGNLNFKKIDDECDIITLKNGEDIKVKILEIGTSEIKYKRCDNLQGPTITVRKSEVFSIKYPNGTKEIISKSSSSSVDGANMTSTNGDKSFVVTLILWFFLGYLGIHRFYLGHIGMGLLYLFTGGLCGIGWIIDIILLLTGGLKPKNGEFKDNL